jgi:TatD DNase family protein
MLVDTHCHLDFDRYDDDLDEVIERAVAADVRKIIVPAVDLRDIPQVLALADKYQYVYTAVGVHPNSTAALPDDWLDQLRDYAEHPKVIAIGEIGLDYYWDTVQPAIQQEAFAAQLELAFDLALPVIIHNRDASDHVLRMLKDSSLVEIEKPGVLHSFMSDWDTAVDAVEMGYFLGFTGPITYKKNDALREIAREMPLDRLLIETDGPFLAPQVRRGKRNEPAYVKYICDYIADLRGIPPTTMANVTTENAACLFGRDIIYR